VIGTLWWLLSVVIVLSVFLVSLQMSYQPPEFDYQQHLAENCAVDGKVFAGYSDINNCVFSLDTSHSHGSVINLRSLLFF